MAVSPPDGSVLASPTPLLVVAPVVDPDPGDTVLYLFRASTSPGGESGTQS